MPRKKKYENALIVKDIFARECFAMDDMTTGLCFKYLDLKKKESREFLKEQIEGVVRIFNDALKELEGEEKKKNGSNDKHTDESEEKTKKSKKK